MPGGIFVTGGHAVAGRDGSVHQFFWAHGTGHSLFGVASKHVGVVQQSLAEQHIDIGNLGKMRRIGGVVQDVIGFNVVGFGGPYCLSDKMGRSKPALAHHLLMLMGCQVGDDLNLQNHIKGCGKRRIVGAWAAHVDDPFLKSNNFTTGDNCNVFQHMPCALACIIPCNLTPGLDDVLDAEYPGGLTWFGQGHIQRLYPVILF